MATSLRLFIEAALTPAIEVAVTASQAHYLTRVMRRASGDPVLVFNGRDGEWRARIAMSGRDTVSLLIDEQSRPQATEPDIWLAFALLKRDATDLVVQKATELGVSALLPLVTDRTVTHRINEARLRTITVEAAEQSERLTVPAVHVPRRFADLLGDWPPERPLFAAVERETLRGVRPMAGPAGLMVGPEGGFTPAELDVLGRCPFVTRVSLGMRILRAETACLAGLALLQAPRCG
jgi:16S rRNA (uracil1498-N3)-methyltransferase